MDPQTSPVTFYQPGVTLFPAWKSNYIHYKVWNVITYLFPNANGCIVEIWELVSNFISRGMR